jgi:hypothetical protein
MGSPLLNLSLRSCGKLYRALNVEALWVASAACYQRRPLSLRWRSIRVSNTRGDELDPDTRIEFTKIV